MKHWRQILRGASDSYRTQDAKGMKLDIASFMRLQETYEVKCLGIRMLGIDFLAEDHEFNHIMRLVKTLEQRYRLSIMQFSEHQDDNSPGMSIKIGFKPTTRVA